MEYHWVSSVHWWIILFNLSSYFYYLFTKILFNLSSYFYYLCTIFFFYLLGIYFLVEFKIMSSMCVNRHYKYSKLWSQCELRLLGSSKSKVIWSKGTSTGFGPQITVPVLLLIACMASREGFSSTLMDSK